MPLLSKGMPLFVQSTPTRNADAAVDLFVHGSSGSGVFAGVDLFVQCESGEGDVKTSSLPLYLAGATSADISKVMNLFIEGRTYDLSDSVDLYLHNLQSGVSLSAPLFIHGAGYATGVVPLVIPNVVGHEENNITMYTHGF